MSPGCAQTLRGFIIPWPWQGRSTCLEVRVLRPTRVNGEDRLEFTGDVRPVWSAVQQCSLLSEESRSAMSGSVAFFDLLDIALQVWYVSLWAGLLAVQ